MVRMFVRHRVADYGTWREGYDAFDGDRPALGVVGQAVFQSVDEPNDITVWHDFATQEAADAFLASPQLRDAMQKAGVQGQPDIWCTTAA